MLSSNSNRARVAEQHDILSFLCEGKLHFTASFLQLPIPIQCPRHEIVTIDILAITELAPCALQYIGAINCSSVIEKEQAPRAMDRTWLPECTD